MGPVMKPNLRQYRLMKAIMREIYKAVESMGGAADLLGSFGETLNDEDVLASLQAWNRANGNGNRR